MASKKKAVVVETPATANVTLSAPAGGKYEIVTLTYIRRAPNNRKRFNADALNELAESIKAMGVAQPILLRPVTPTDEQPEKYEIVAGERRYRASIIAGMQDIPALIRELSDLDADKLRILENLQREDPHPIEEAEGYQDLMLKHGYNADQLAAEIKKSRSYVFGRLKLCALNNDVREKFVDGAINASIALLIARIPIPALQTRALQEVTEIKWPTNEPMSYRKAAEHIQTKYMLDLAESPFDLKDAKLLASAGSCVKCPKRTGNQPDLYPEIKSADVCTDPDCYGEKRAAYYAHVVVMANKKGIPVHEGEEARVIRSQQWNRQGEHVLAETGLMYFERNAPETRNGGSPKTLLSEAELPPVAAYVKDADGRIAPLYRRDEMQAALEKNGACETLSAYTARMNADEDEGDDEDESGAPQSKHSMSDRERKHAELRARAEAETKYRVELYKKVRAHGTAGFSLESLREFVKMLVRADYGFSIPDGLIGDVYPFPEATDDAVCNYIDHATLPEVQLVLVDLVMGECLSVSPYDIEDLEEHFHAEEFNALLAMARHEEVDPAAVRARLEDQAPAADVAEQAEQAPAPDGETPQDAPAADSSKKAKKAPTAAPLAAWPFPRSSEVAKTESQPAEA